MARRGAGVEGAMSTERPILFVDERAAWDAYRADPQHRPLLEAAGVAGPDDMEAALASPFVVHDGGEDADDTPILLGERVFHTLCAHDRERRNSPKGLRERIAELEAEIATLRARAVPEGLEVWEGDALWAAIDAAWTMRGGA